MHMEELAGVVIVFLSLVLFLFGNYEHISKFQV